MKATINEFDWQKCIDRALHPETGAQFKAELDDLLRKFEPRPGHYYPSHNIRERVWGRSRSEILKTAGRAQ
jgi:hypothetical protein